MRPAGFHPLVGQWWGERFGDAPPTPAQVDGWKAIREGRHTLIAAPTGSGKTLAAFLTAIDTLTRESLERGGLPDEVRVIYVSPLKALSADIHKNLAEPRREIRRIAEEAGKPVRITAAVRSGDTPQNERAAMLKTPPHILVTTPESLYLLLTAERSRNMLKTATVVIVDEIHAMVESRRGAHLALTLERLDHACCRRLQRVGLSATQKPIETVARFLVGNETDEVAIVDRGHKRALDLALEIPKSPLEAVMSLEVWQENYARLVALIESHRTTLVMVNTRRLAERMAHQLSERLGADKVAAHHGSLAKEVRLSAEERLRNGELKVLVATASLELGIDIGHVDLVCQVSSPNRIATLLQRVGRSGHWVGGTPKGRVFPLTRDDLVECAAMLHAAREGELDAIRVPEAPLDVLAQQIVAEAAADEGDEGWNEDDLYALARRAWPYRNLSRKDFDEVVEMLAHGFATQRGRRAALVHHDAVNGRIRPRAGSRMTAIMSGGAIPEVFDYRVMLEPEGTFIGTLNEDFAIESLPGDIFQLGNTSWRILQIGSGVVRVADAGGQPPSMPFWLGEGPARSDEMSAAVSRMRDGADPLLPGPETPRLTGELEPAIAWLMKGYTLERAAAEQIAAYFGEAKRSLGALPSMKTLVLERFFDESGGMQLVLHAPFGSRVNRAWGLALRKKFCQSFNFELQAAATEEGVILSLGAAHSFPLEEVFRYLHPNTVRETLVQAALAAPMFETRWRWVATLALAVPRMRNGAKLPAQLQRMAAQDILAAAFPDAAACQDNIQGAREVPDHPLVNQTIRDCLEEAMDYPGLIRELKHLYAGEFRLVARDTPEPSVLCHELLNSAVYTFLDDAPLEERRTRAVYTRRATDIRDADDLGALDPAAIDRVREEAWPQANNADELLDALLMAGFVRSQEAIPSWRPLFDALIASGRAVDAGGYWVAVERFDELAAVVPQKARPAIPDRLAKTWAREDALRELIRSRLDVLGPATALSLADSLGLPDAREVDVALIALETEGRILRGRFSRDAAAQMEWCDRRLLARIHRYTLNRLRAEIEPCTAAEFLRFLTHWQRVSPAMQMSGPEGLAGVIEQLEGCEVAAGAWESQVLPPRVKDYAPAQLDGLCLAGRVAWGRLAPMESAGKAPLRSSPIALAPRADAHWWRSAEAATPDALSAEGRAVHAFLAARGASFFHELVAGTRLLPSLVERALGELAGAGLATADSFAGLRALLVPADKRGDRRRLTPSVEAAGRWSLLAAAPAEDSDAARQEHIARALLRRYGVVFRMLLSRESRLPTWRELVAVYRRLEARGEIRGGRFVTGFGGEQFALPEAVGKLRALRKESAAGEIVVLSAVDPLNLVGVLTPEAKVTSVATNRILLRDGVPLAALEAGSVRRLAESELSDDTLRDLLKRRGAASPRSWLRPERPPRGRARSVRPPRYIPA